MPQRINGVYAKPIHAKAFETVVENTNRKLKRMREIMDFVSAFEISNLIKENSFYKSAYKAEGVRSKKKNEIIKNQREQIEKLKEENEFQKSVIEIQKDELKRKNDLIVANTCKKYELKQYHINTILKAQTKGPIEENE